MVDSGISDGWGSTPIEPAAQVRLGRVGRACEQKRGDRDERGRAVERPRVVGEHAGERDDHHVLGGVSLMLSTPSADGERRDGRSNIATNAAGSRAAFGVGAVDSRRRRRTPAAAPRATRRSVRATTWSTAYAGYVVRSGAARNASVRTIRSAVTITVRRGLHSSRVDPRQLREHAGVAEPSASWTWTTATSGRAGRRDEACPLRSSRISHMRCGRWTGTSVPTPARRHVRHAAMAACSAVSIVSSLQSSTVTARASAARRKLGASPNPRS